MDVQTQSAAKALDDGHASRPPVTDPVSARAVALEAQQHTHGHARQHLVDNTGGALRHAPPAATRAEAPALAGKRYEPLHSAVGASQACEAVRQHPAGQEVSKLLFHEPRQGGSVSVTLLGAPASDLDRL